MKAMFSIPGISTRKFLISYAVGLILLYFFLRNTEWRTVLTGLQTVAWPLLGAAIIVRFATLMTASLRWQELLLPVRKIRLASVFNAMLIGTSVSAGVSMQAAEFVRPYVLSQSEGLDFASALSTVVVEWLLDLSAILAVFIPAVILVRRPEAGHFQFSGMIQGLLLLILVSIMGFVALQFIQRHTAGMQRYFDRGPSWLPGTISAAISGQMGHFATGLKVLQQPKGCAVVSGYSLLVSILTAMSCWLALAAFGLPLPVVSAFVILGLISLGGAIPTPAAIGGFHAICQFGLVAFFGVDSARAVLPVIGLHAVLYLPPAIAGLFCLFDFGRIGKGALTS